MTSRSQDRVLEALQTLVGQSGQSVTAADIAKEMNLSRQVTSHYLTRLLEAGLVQKTATKPVYWQPLSIENNHRQEESINPFQAFIGWQGSQQEIIEQCKAAVDYPPNGLPILIHGKSGVGKSFLASLVHQYALSKRVIADHAPFIELNCADYANNPELLSATLFGYKKGAFTGADSDKEGLIRQADGGYLFFDEIHRLSHENQEKLFLFMDKGVYRPIGENKEWSHANVRLIFATTEQVDDVLLTTFSRRIPVRIHISDLNERPFTERLMLVLLCYKKEAEKINRDLYVQADVLETLCFCVLKGNVGKLRNIIRLSCAKAFTTQQEKKQLTINKTLLSLQSDKDIRHSLHLESVLIQPDQNFVQDTIERETPYQQEFGHFMELASHIKTDDKAALAELVIDFRKLMSEASQHKEEIPAVEQQVLASACYCQLEQLSKQYGVKLKPEAKNELGWLLHLLLHAPDTDIETFNRAQRSIQCFFQRAYYLAGRIGNMLDDVIDEYYRPSFIGLLSFFLHELVNENINLHGIIVAHGPHTATSIQSVVNQICRAPIFEAMNMPMTTDVQAITQQINDYLQQIDTSKGLILLVDMGSLTQLYSSIKHQLKSDLLVINNLTTAVALDIGMKMAQNLPFKQIAEQVKNGYKIEVRYFEGLTQGSNLIISCMSGVGISNRIKEILTRYIAAAKLDILTMEYKELRDALRRNDKSYFKQTQFIITTTDLPEDLDIFSINIFEILEERGQQILWQRLKHFVSEESFRMLLRDILKLFSIEGVSNRLSFLNPQIIIHEVEHVIALYEKYYEVSLNGKIKLNLYMHIALMVERLITTKGKHQNEKIDIQEMNTPEGSEFTAITHEIFHEIETKYNIQVNGYERSLLYDLIKPFLYVKKI